MKTHIFVFLVLCGIAAGAAELEEGFTPLFNGKDLTGWEGDTTLWKAENGMLVGRSPGIKQNTFLVTAKPYSDFLLRFSFRLVDGKGNSGVQFRSSRVPNSKEMSGYQADIGEVYWGCLYDESRRNRILVKPDEATLNKAAKFTDWNEYEVKAIGNQITLTLNGVTVAEYTEQAPGIAASGLIAPQLHAGGPMEIQFRNLRIKEVPPAGK